MLRNQILFKMLKPRYNINKNNVFHQSNKDSFSQENNQMRPEHLNIIIFKNTPHYILFSELEVACNSLSKYSEDKQLHFIVGHLILFNMISNVLHHINLCILSSQLLEDKRKIKKRKCTKKNQHFIPFLNSEAKTSNL